MSPERPVCNARAAKPLHPTSLGAYSGSGGTTMLLYSGAPLSSLTTSLLGILSLQRRVMVTGAPDRVPISPSCRCVETRNSDQYKPERVQYSPHLLALLSRPRRSRPKFNKSQLRAF